MALAAGLIAVGIIALPKMHSDVLPELSQGPVLEVQTESPGLSSQEVEQYITVPMENNLLDGIMGVWDVRSRSTPGLATVDLYFEPGTTTLHARQLVEERLTNSFSLPAVNKPPQLIQPLSSTSRALMIGLNSSKLSPLELSYLARWVLKPRLAGVAGVANVAIFGQQDRQIQVQVDPARLAARHVTLQQVINTAGNAQLVSPLTYLEGSAPGTGGFLDGPNQRIDIRPVLPLGAPKDLAAVPISDAPGKPTLGDVARVVQSHQALVGTGLTRHGAGLVLLVQKLPSASVPGVTKGIERALNELRPALRGVTIDTSFFRPASYISSALDNLALALVLAAVLGIVALAALLLDARALFLAAISIALSLLAAALVLYALGYTLNALVVLGLVVASGVIVDDAVGGTTALVARARQRSRDGAVVSLQQLIVEATVELRSTLGYATLIVLLTIAPVFFAKGLTATYVHSMALAFALAVIASTLVAVTFTPAIGMLLFERNRARRRGLALGARVAAGYDAVMRRAVSIPRGVLAALCMFGLAAAIAFPFLNQPSSPQFKDRNVVVQWTGPPGAGLTEMNRITSRVSGSLRALPSVSDVAATLGRATSGDRIVDTNSGQIFVRIKPQADYGRAMSGIRGIVGAIAGVQASVSTYEGDVQQGVFESPDKQVAVRIYGQDYSRLHALATRLQGLIGRVHGLGPSHVTAPTLEPNVDVTINDAAAHNAGVLPGDARRQASTLVSGLTVGNFFEQQAVFDAVVWSVPSVRSNLESVRNLPIDTAGGGHVPLSSIAKVSVAPGPAEIQHQGLSRYVDVTAPVNDGTVSDAQSAVQRQLSQLSFPLSYHAEVQGTTPLSPTSHLKFLSYGLAALIGILLLLQAAFGSWRLASMFLLALPLALVGGLIVALVSGQDRTLGADVGLLAVFVFAARQGVLQIAQIRRRHAEHGGQLTPAIVSQATHDRLGPALTAVLVSGATMIPFVLVGNVAGNEITHTTAAVILGGLVTATVLNQVLIPVMCLVLGPKQPANVEEPEAEIDHTTVPTPSVTAS
ncbi:MAG: efflux RND transporter permease subunit [Solirubrobacteraceae bacterium]